MFILLQLTLEESQFFPLIPDYSFRSETTLPSSNKMPQNNNLYIFFLAYGLE